MSRTPAVGFRRFTVQSFSASFRSRVMDTAVPAIGIDEEALLKLC